MLLIDLEPVLHPPENVSIEEIKAEQIADDLKLGQYYFVYQYVHTL